VDPSFRARALVEATGLAAETALESAGAGSDHPGPLERGRRVAETLAGHWGFGSVWFRNAVRGAVGLALAVGLVELTAVEHGFWVILGTLSVLRSNALGTGSSALRALGGTAVGFVLGSALMLGPGEHRPVLWVLLPLAVFLCGVAPTMISFAAGQAAFTVMVVVLLNIISPSGWTVALVRIEDVALGCAVSVVVGVLLWPRGATAQFAQSLGRAYDAASAYLSAAVARLACTSSELDTAPEQRRTAAACSRLDDAFRQFAAEHRGDAQRIRLATNLFAGAVTLRMAAHSLATLTPVAAPAGEGDLEAVIRAGHRLQGAFENVHDWYLATGEVLTGNGNGGASPAPPPSHVGEVHHELLEALGVAQQAHRPDQVRSTLRMLWADQVLDELEPMQEELASAAHTFSDPDGNHRRGPF
jgi:uncharacterized membrane protein YccC